MAPAHYLARAPTLVVASRSMAEQLLTRDDEKRLRAIATLDEFRRVFPLVLELAVSWGEMDAYGHVNNAVFMRYFENARVNYLTRCGWDEVEERLGAKLVVRRLDTGFLKQLQYPARIFVGARIPDGGAAQGDRFKMEYAVAQDTKNENVSVVSVGASDNVLLDKDDAKWQLTDEVRKLFETFEAHPRTARGARPLIAVVGKTKKVSGPVSTLARQVGDLVAQKGVLLTGGRPGSTQVPSAVKDAAMDGAVDAGKRGEQARMIGILPGADEVADVKLYPNLDTRCLLVRTTLSSEARNVLSGSVADSVIALSGGPGTISEIGFAVHHGRPVVFLDSFEQLRSVFERESVEIRRILDAAKNEYNGEYAVDVDRVMTGLERTFSSEPHTATTALAAVNQAISLSGTRLPLVDAFIAHKDRTVPAWAFERDALALFE